MPNVLLIDHSGRGHSFAELFVRTNPTVTVYYASGCDAISTERVISVERVALNDADGMIALAREIGAEFVFVANTVALCNGFADRFRAAGLKVIGPEHRASRLESSKTFGKEFCSRHGIRVAEWRSFDDPDEAKRYVVSRDHPVVVKADGLCGGNGSFVCDTAGEAFAAIDKLMVERFFDASGERIVIEKRLFGRELSFFVLVDPAGGHQMLPMALDYPKSDDCNTGLTSGGMGALSPHPLESPGMYRMAEEQLVRPVLEAIQREGMLYSGVLYLGTMLVGDELYLLEINVRLGDPEAEVVTSRIASDFYAHCNAILEGRLASEPIAFDARHYCNVVAAQGRTRARSNGRNKGWYQGWPYGRFGKGYAVSGVDRIDISRCKVFLGEASRHPEKGLVSDGGRVIHVVGFGADLDEAVRNAYDNIGRIHFEGMRYRTDIGRVMPWDVFDDAELAGTAAPGLPRPVTAGEE